MRGVGAFKIENCHSLINLDLHINGPKVFASVPTSLMLFEMARCNDDTGYSVMEDSTKGVCIQDDIF